jgi:hypothetical protein
MPTRKQTSKSKEKDLIYDSLVSRGLVKQIVSNQTKNLFQNIVFIVKQIHDELKRKLDQDQLKLDIGIQEKLPNEIEIRLNDEVLIFYMHTNVFMFDQDHIVWQTPYIQEDQTRAFCGMILIYNFLADSLRFNRNYDTGYLIGRIFINKDEHLYVEGKRQLGFLYNDIENNQCSPELLNKIIESAFIYALNFDTLVPPFEVVKEITVQQKIEQSGTLNLQTGKRMGFRFSADMDDITRK